jgi:HD superfamily phosphohydrolase
LNCKPTGNPAYGKKSKLYNDPIHGFFRLSSGVISATSLSICLLKRYQIIFADALTFIDTPQFQRLRDLKQLGVTSFVFPGAVHDRFQHSVGKQASKSTLPWQHSLAALHWVCAGVYHLSAQLVEKLQVTQPELAIERGDSTAVAIAGLTHDLGHGPYSHVFDNEFIPRVEPNATFSHEEMGACTSASCSEGEKTAALATCRRLVLSASHARLRLAGLDILDWAIDDNQIETLDTIGKQKVRDMIVATKPSVGTRMEEREFLYQIVANGRWFRCRGFCDAGANTLSRRQEQH